MPRCELLSHSSIAQWLRNLALVTSLLDKVSRRCSSSSSSSNRTSSAGAIFAYVDVDVDINKLSGPAQRINITLPKWVLRQMDLYAKQASLPRSTLIANAALNISRVIAKRSDFLRTESLFDFIVLSESYLAEYFFRFNRRHDTKRLFHRATMTCLRAKPVRLGTLLG